RAGGGIDGGGGQELIRRGAVVGWVHLYAGFTGSGGLLHGDQVPIERRGEHVDLAVPAAVRVDHVDPSAVRTHRVVHHHRGDRIHAPVGLRGDRVVEAPRAAAPAGGSVDDRGRGLPRGSAIGGPGDPDGRVVVPAEVHVAR